jgi:nitrogen regulatory protein PII
MEATDIQITFIVSHGDAYDIMTVAREVGAKGGTIVEAHGTLRESDVQFFGMTLVSEKEMLIIISERDTAEKILDAVKDLAVFKKAGGGIIYTTEVKRFVP